MRHAFFALILASACIGPAMAGTVAAETSQAALRLSQVEVVGVTAFPSDVIENMMEIGPGDLLDRSKIVKTAENIQNLYKNHGYEEVTIETRLVRKNVLEIQIGEGAPTRIAEVEFVPENQPSTTSARDAWKRASRALRVTANLEAGDILDKEKINATKRALQDVLVTEEYIGARVDEVQAVPADEPSSHPEARSGGKSSEMKSRWVNVRFLVRLGDRVTFGFRGNEVISTARLTAIVNEQRTLGLGQDFVAVIRSRIEDEYRALGYSRVHAEPYTFGNPNSDERHVTYQITEGQRVKIEGVEFDGNSVFSARELRAKFFDIAPNMVQRGWYVEKDVQRAAELVIEWMKSKGYLGAKLVTINTTYVPRAREDEKDSLVRLVIYVYESEQTLLQSLRLSGVTVFKQDEVEKILGNREGEPFNVFAFGEGLEKLKVAYRARGYLGISIGNEGTDKLVHYSDENRWADINLDVNEGPQYRVSHILIEGRQKTRETVILRELLLHEGDVVEEPKVADSETNLRKLGIFSLVRIVPTEDPGEPGKKMLKVLVEEADPGIIAGGPGFRNDLGIRGFAEFGYTNLDGLDHSIFLNASANRRIDHTFRFMEYQTQIAYNWPWFNGWNVDFRPTISLSGTEYANFDAVTAELGLNWEKKLLKKPNLSFLFSYDLERVNQFNTTVDDQVDKGQFLIGSITPALRLDMRDNPLAPTSGLFSQISFEYADPWLGSQRAPSPIGYYRLQTRNDYTIQLAPMMSWFVSIRTGFEKSTVSAPGDNAYGQIPLIKQFALGGIGSLRGFSEQELNAQTDVIKGSLSYVNYRTQLDFPISGGLRFGPFLDAANLNVDSFSFGDLRYGTGFGFHYLTPVGPVNLDWGFKVNPQPGEDTNQFYFSIGVL